MRFEMYFFVLKFVIKFMIFLKSLLYSGAYKIYGFSKVSHTELDGWSSTQHIWSQFCIAKVLYVV